MHLQSFTCGQWWSLQVHICLSPSTRVHFAFDSFDKTKLGLKFDVESSADNCLATS